VVADVPSILITDDDRDFRETLCGVFEPHGFRTYTAADGAEALDVVGREEVHLALFDMHMPRLSGLDAIRHLKQQLHSPLPCILISAEADERLIAEARAVQAFDVLKKPVTRDGVIAVVFNALRTAYDAATWRSVLRTQ
jgi:CheY-like chemotaxis protein